MTAEERRGKAVADIAKEAGTGHLVYGSISGADLHTGIAHVESKGRIEEHIEALGLPATILRPVSFMENFASYNRPVMAGGELVVSLALCPETPLQLIATRDIGILAAIAIDQPGRFLGQHIEIAADKLTGPAIADTFGRACNVPARFQQVPIDQLRGFDAEVAKMFAWLKERAIDGPDIATLRALHPGLMTLQTWVRQAGWKP